ncbi:MAG: PASTA domain-containing protein [Clostridia bacterium]|nr:PASTA domain-containing protein [Clostridia bacterium]
MKDMNLQGKKRIFSVFAFVVIVLVALVGRCFWIQFVDGPNLQIRAIEQQTKDKTINSKRGVIYDRNGKILAQSASVELVSVNPREIADAGNADFVADTLSSILGLDRNAVFEKLHKNSSYEIIKRRVEKPEAEAIRGYMSYTNESGETVNMMKGVYLSEDTKRYYPYGPLAAHVIGFVGTDNQGLSGVELSFDNYLKGLPGRVVTAKNAIGTDMPYQYEKYINPENGANLVLTIDETIQHFVEKHLEQAVAEYNVQNGAACIIMNCKTGEILAMATYPSYDLNDPFTLNDPAVQAEIDALSGEERTTRYNEAIQQMWRNKAVVDTYEPGSTFKGITTAMALEENVVGVNDMFNCSGHLQVGPHSIGCWKSGGHGSLTFVQGVENSCNPVFMTVGSRIGPQNFYKYYKAFGFAEKTGFDLPGEAVCAFHAMENFNEVELATSSFGQSFQITPLQLVTAYSAICNDGTMVRPRIAKALVDDDGNVLKTFETEYIRKVISAETAATTRTILESVVTNGTSKNAYIPGFRIAGKTGTSEKLPRGNGKYIASFLGFAPANDPEIIGLLILDEPMGDTYMGGQIAAPTFKLIFDDVLRYMGVEPQYTTEEIETMDLPVPNVVGLPVADVSNAFANSGLKYQIVGDGDTIVSQIPNGGTALPSGSTVVLYTRETSENDVVVPDVVGCSVTETNRRITNAGLNIKISGDAEVKDGEAVAATQSPPPGTLVPKGTVVTVEFKYINVH